LLAYQIPVPEGQIVQKGQEIVQNKYPCMVKPTNTENSVGMTLVRSPEDLAPALDKAFSYGSDVIVDKFISGREIRCSVVERLLPDGEIEYLTTLPQEYHVDKNDLRKTEDKLVLDENGIPLGKKIRNVLNLDFMTI